MKRNFLIPIIIFATLILTLNIFYITEPPTNEIIIITNLHLFLMGGILAINGYISYKTKNYEIFNILTIIFPMYFILQTISLINNDPVDLKLFVQFMNQISMTTGIILGISISYLLFTKLKLRVLTFLPIVISLFFILFGFSNILDPFTTTFRKLLNQINPYITDFFNLLISGGLIGIISHLIISKYQKVGLITVFVTSIIISYYELGSYKFEPFITKIPTFTIFDKYKILFTILIIILAFLHYSKSLKKTLKPTIVLASTLIISLSTAYYTGNILIKNIISINQELKEINNKQDKTFFPKNTPPQESDSAWEKYDPEEEYDLAIVGYYKATEPLYLKTEIYEINRYNSLNIKPIKDIDGKYYSKYSNQENSNDTSDLNSNQSEIKIIFKYKEDQLLPTTAKVTSFENEFFSENFKIFTSDKYNTNNVWHHTYQYQDYDPYKDYQPTYDQTIQQDLSKTNFNYISKYSPDYSKIKALTEQITKEYKTDYKKAKAVENYLKTNYYYSLKPNIKNQENPISEFILENKHGYCTHFATAMSIMLDSVDIQSRVVGGFYSKKYSQQLNSFVMLNTDLHAWTEVFIKDYGWTTFDATSGRCDSQTDNCHKISQNKKESDENINYLLYSVNPKLGFDDIFNETQKVEFPKEPEEPKKPEPKEEIKNEMNSILKYSAIVALTLLILTILYIFKKKIISLIKNVINSFKNSEENEAKKLNRKLKETILNSLKRKNIKSRNIFRLTDKEFIRLISKHYPEMKEDLKKFYTTLNKILYSRNSTSKDLTNLKKLFQKLIKHIKNQQKSNN